jgi:uncharacterized protein YbjT (DUF2867 family)
MILVVGGTGDLGGRVVRSLRARDSEVRCLVRPGTDDARVRRLGAEVVRGDLTDPGSLAMACAHAHTVVATATAIGRRLAGAGKPSIRDVDGDGMASLVAAAEAAGVERFVYVSYAGVDAGLGMPLERAKLATERRLAGSDLDRVVVVRPDAFQEVHLAPLGRFDMAKGKVSVFGAGDGKQRYVGTDDVAALLAAVAIEPDPPAQVTFGGPEAITRNEAIALAEELTGRPIKVQRMPAVLARVGMRLLDRPNDALASVFGTGLLQDRGSGDWDDEPLRQRGITPKPATDFLREQAALLIGS